MSLLKLAPDTTARIVTNGVDRQLPTIVLEPFEARLVVEYAGWLTRQSLRAALWCHECWDARPSITEGAEWQRESDRLALLCSHRLLFFSGPLPAPAMPSTLILPRSHQALLAAADGATIEDLSAGDALLLRCYQKLLKRYRLRDALRCDHCFSMGNTEGVRAFVTPLNIGVLCRHRQLRFSGATL